MHSASRRSRDALPQMRGRRRDPCQSGLARPSDRAERPLPPVWRDGGGPGMDEEGWIIFFALCWAIIVVIVVVFLRR